MMWVLLLLVALAIFLAMAFVLKLPRIGWELTGTALLVGIAGYALQGHPGQAGAPKEAVETAKTADEAMIKQRQDMSAGPGGGQNWLVTADGFSRNGQYGTAAQLLSRAVKENPENPDLWIGLGVALVEHSNGMISPAATFAFQKAADINPEHPGPPFFFGQALAQSGRLPEARQVWSELLARTPAESPLHDELQSRVSRIDAMLGAASGQGETGAVPPVAAPKADAPAADASATP